MLRKNTKSKCSLLILTFAWLSFENSNPNPPERPRWGQLQWDHWLCQPRVLYGRVPRMVPFALLSTYTRLENNVITGLRWAVDRFEIFSFPSPVNKIRLYWEIFSYLNPYGIFLPESSKLSQFSTPRTQVLSNQTQIYNGGIAPRNPGSCYCCGKWQVPSKETHNVGEHITEYHLQCAPVQSQASSFSQETLDSGGTICLCEGSRLSSPCYSPALWDCPRCLLIGIGERILKCVE